MRLSTEQAATVRQAVDELFSPAAKVLLFGSRVDNEACGGDIDLLVETPIEVARSAFAAANLAARLERQFNGRRVDVVLVTPSTPEQPIHRIARQQGILL